MLKNMKKSTKSNLVTLSIVVGFYIFIQILGGVGLLTNSFSGQLVPICAYVILAVSLNLTVGILGELSLGHAGFMSVGAFSGTLVYVVLHETAPQPLAMLLAFVVGGVVAGLFGFFVGIPVLRLSGDYLAIVTLAFGEIVKNVMNACYLGLDSRGLHFSLKDSASLNLEADGKVLINGAMGITGIKKASTFTIGIVLVIITLLVILNLVNSRAGRAITAIRDNEIAARCDLRCLCGRGGRIVRAELFLSGRKKVRLQHLHPDSGVCRSGRHRQSARLGHCGHSADGSAGAAAQHERLPDADLCDRADRCDDL